MHLLIRYNLWFISDCISAALTDFDTNVLPLCDFTPPAVWAGVNAPHCLIVCPSRRIQPERYLQYGLKLIKNIVKKNSCLHFRYSVYCMEV
jgi:hypothetical protein